MGTQLPLKGAQLCPPFSAHVYCGQTVGWIKMPLGTVVGFGPCHIVLDGDPAPPKSGTAAPLFCSMPIVATVAHLSYCWALVTINICCFISKFNFKGPASFVIICLTLKWVICAILYVMCAILYSAVSFYKISLTNCANSITERFLGNYFMQPP